MPVRMISRRREPRRVTIKLIDGSMIKGQVNLYHEEMTMNRVSDLFLRVKEPFIVVFVTTINRKKDRAIIVNKQNILWVLPEEE